MSAGLVTYGSLTIAILCEVSATAFLQRSEQFTRVGPTIAMAMLYLVSFYFLALALKGMPVGIAYAIWSGLGIVLTASLGYILFRQSLDAMAIVGLGLIMVGVVVVNAFSGGASH